VSQSCLGNGGRPGARAPASPDASLTVCTGFVARPIDPALERGNDRRRAAPAARPRIEGPDPVPRRGVEEDT